MTVNLSDLTAPPLERCLARQGDGAACGGVKGHRGGHQYGALLDALWDRIHLREMPCPLCGMHPVYRAADHSALFEEAPE